MGLASHPTEPLKGKGRGKPWATAYGLPAKMAARVVTSAWPDVKQNAQFYQDGDILLSAFILVSPLPGTSRYLSESATSQYLVAAFLFHLSQFYSKEDGSQITKNSQIFCTWNAYSLPHHLFYHVIAL